MKETTPIKRSPELQPLSREHHDGLLFVWNLRKELKAGTSTSQLVSFVNTYWKNHIRPHFFQEERILMPYMPKDALMERMKKEHEYIRELIVDIDTDCVRDDIVKLADLIETHIRFEERELFQSLEQRLTKEDLWVIQEQLEQHPVSCGGLKDESGKE